MVEVLEEIKVEGVANMEMAMKAVSMVVVVERMAADMEAEAVRLAMVMVVS